MLLYLRPDTFGLAYSFLNSANPNFLTEVTLAVVHDSQEREPSTRSQARRPLLPQCGR